MYLIEFICILIDKMYNIASIILCHYVLFTCLCFNLKKRLFLDLKTALLF